MASPRIRHRRHEHVSLSFRTIPNSQGSPTVPAISADRQSARERLHFRLSDEPKQHRNKLRSTRRQSRNPKRSERHSASLGVEQLCSLLTVIFVLLDVTHNATNGKIGRSSVTELFGPSYRLLALSHPASLVTMKPGIDEKVHGPSIGSRSRFPLALRTIRFTSL
jgi:hypothetical protein